MAEIIVETLSSSSGGAIFQVKVRDESGQTEHRVRTVSYTHLRAPETGRNSVCRLVR